MVQHDENVVMKAIALCFKPYLKPEEALIYTNLGRTQFAKRAEQYGVYKSNSGYFKKEDLDRMLSGESSRNDIAANMVIRLRKRRSNQVREGD